MVFQARGNVFFFVAEHALLDDRLLEFGEQRSVPRNQPRLDERRLGLHIRVGRLDAIVQIAHGITNLQADVPKRIQDAVNQPRESRQRLGSGNLTFMQEHEINVAVWIQLGAAEAADGYE